MVLLKPIKKISRTAQHSNQMIETHMTLDSAHHQAKVELEIQHLQDMAAQ